MELDLMTTETKEKLWDGKTERRKGRRPRRRLVDLTLTPGTDRRKSREDRRKESADLTKNKG
jgi:hypothetical protein